MRKILLLGIAGSGKSTFVENWFGIKNISSNLAYSKTEYPALFVKQYHDCLIDTPGLFDVNVKQDTTRSQKMMNNLSNQLRNTNQIDLVVIFHKHTGRLDENFTRMMNDYNTLLNLQSPLIVLCFTGIVEDDQREGIRQYFHQTNMPYLIKWCFWELSFKAKLNNFRQIKDLISVELFQGHKPHKSRLIEKIILKETLIRSLEKDLSYYNSQAIKNEAMIARIMGKLAECPKSDYFRDVEGCPGMTARGFRCTRSKFCHWYINYLANVAPMHHSAELQERVEGVQTPVELLQQIEQMRLEERPQEDDSDPKEPIRLDEYDNLMELVYSEEMELPDYDSYEGIGIFKITIAL